MEESALPKGTERDSQFRLDRRIAYAWMAVAILLLLPMPNIPRTGIVAMICFLLWPQFWEPRELGNQRSAIGRPLFAALLTIIIAVGAWKTVERSMGTPTSAVEEQVASQLRDPSSAQFRNLHGDTAICGEVNGKNAFGAYAGFRRFVYEDGAIVMEPEEPIGASVSEMTTYYNAVADFARAQQSCYR